MIYGSNLCKQVLKLELWRLIFKRLKSRLMFKAPFSKKIIVNIEADVLGIKIALALGVILKCI